MIRSDAYINRPVNLDPVALDRPYPKEHLRGNSR